MLRDPAHHSHYSDVSCGWRRSHCLSVPSAQCCFLRLEIVSVFPVPSAVSQGWRLSLCSSCLVMFPLAGKEVMISVFQLPIDVSIASLCVPCS
jgi:hypothetical protein